MDSDATSEIRDIEQARLGSVDIIYSGSDASTTVNIEVSNDKTNWKTLECGEITLASGAGYETFGLGEDVFTHHYLRASYTAGAATSGIITIYLRLKRGNR